MLTTQTLRSDRARLEPTVVPLPQDRNSRLYYRSSKKRMEEAALLNNCGMTTGAVYLAGYGVECISKALILSRVPVARQPEVMAKFKGEKAHQFEWLLDQYAAVGGGRLPVSVHRQFQPVKVWTTKLRYEPGSIGRKEADKFLTAVHSIMAWADGRL